MSDLRRRAKYTQEFKEESVRQVLAGSSIRAVADSLGIPKASLGNWVRQHELGDLGPTRHPHPRGQTRVADTADRRSVAAKWPGGHVRT